MEPQHFDFTLDPCHVLITTRAASDACVVAHGIYNIVRARTYSGRADEVRVTLRLAPRGAAHKTPVEFELVVHVPSAYVVGVSLTQGRFVLVQTPPDPPPPSQADI